MRGMINIRYNRVSHCKFNYNKASSRNYFECCIDCKKRILGCHSTCIDYLKEKERKIKDDLEIKKRHTNKRTTGKHDGFKEELNTIKNNRKKGIKYIPVKS